jgi:hypothetical protein
MGLSGGKPDQMSRRHDSQAGFAARVMFATSLTVTYATCSQAQTQQRPPAVFARACS